MIIVEFMALLLLYFFWIVY